jgi:adenylate cyclase
MGNAVNLASRLEGVNKKYRTGGILVSKSTRMQAGDDFVFLPLDRVRVKGIDTPLRIYELVAAREVAGEKTQDLLAEWRLAMRCYYQRRFAEAAERFLTISPQLEAYFQSGVAGYFAERSKTFQANPPPANWDRVNQLTEK